VNKRKIIILITLVILVLALSFHFFSKADGPDLNIKSDIFRHSVLYSSGSDKAPAGYYNQGYTESYCLGPGGGAEQSQPCVFLLNQNYDIKEGRDNETCLSVSYIPEINYYSSAINPEVGQRALVFPDDSWKVWICGTFFQSWPGGPFYSPDPMNPDHWYFKTDQFVREEIRKQLTEQGYPL
jgi:hypothetical protein